MNRETKWILSFAYASTMTMHIYGAYDTTEQVLEELQDYFDDTNLTLDIIMDKQWQNEGEIDIQECKYVPSQAVIRNYKINEIIK